MSKLREGFTTGTAASAAAMAGVLYLGDGRKCSSVRVGIPVGGTLSIPVAGYREEPDGVRVTVMKDGGDDPDATHKAKIVCLVRLDREHAGEVIIDGGKGVGRVTRPGLPVAVGRAAINPVPMAQIEGAVREAAREAGIVSGISVTVEVLNGERIARKTLNGRLGIVGGISILGTRGTVKPFSHEAYTATIRQCLDSARAMGLREVGFSTGGRSERLLQGLLPWPEGSFLQVADFFAPAMAMAAERDMDRVVWGVFYGKLVKQAQGHSNTHAKHAPVDFERLHRWWLGCGGDGAVGREIAGANTAMQVYEMIRELPAAGRFTEFLVEKAVGHAREYAEGKVDVAYVVFTFDGEIIHSTLENSL